MSGWLETYRGVVNPWECDVVEHFTVAYYFNRFGDATLRMGEAIGLGLSYMEAERCGCASVDCYVRFQEELRAGDAFHIESGVIDIDDKRLRLGHKVYNSATGAVVATLEQLQVHFHLDRRKSVAFSQAQRDAVEKRRIDWDVAEREARETPEDTEGFLDAYSDSTKPWEIDVLGHVSFEFYIHRFTAAALQVLAAIGWTAAYSREERRGLSTFEFQLQFHREIKAGELVHVKTGLMHLGNSSIRVLHKMFNSRTGELVATLSQYGVHLDMEARRPTGFPDAIREKGQGLLVKAPA